MIRVCRELAARLGRVRPVTTVPVEDTVGPREARGATVAGSQIHSLRLPGFVIIAEIIFGMPDQRLTIRHDSGGSAIPYVDRALLAMRGVATLVGLHRGLDTVLNSDGFLGMAALMAGLIVLVRHGPHASSRSTI